METLSKIPLPSFKDQIVKSSDDADRWNTVHALSTTVLNDREFLSSSMQIYDR
jgi:hypothetical protein